MEGRGRKSAASLSVISGGIVPRMEPPAGLSTPEADLFRRVVASKPADWFAPDNLPLLVEYVRAVAMADALAERISRAEELSEVKALLDMRDKESRRATSLATKMRLSQQSTYTDKSADTARRRGGGGKPWQFDGN